MSVLPGNMVDIFCTFLIVCSNFTSFFFSMKRSSVTLVYIIFCLVFNSSRNGFHSYVSLCLTESEIILLNKQFFFHLTCVQHEVVNGKSLVKC